MNLIRYIGFNSKIDFMSQRLTALAASGGAIILSLVLFLLVGLNYGIDFLGGTLIEIKKESAWQLDDVRSSLNELDVGDVSVQEFGDPTIILVRIQKQDNEKSDQQAIQNIKSRFRIDYERDNIVFRRVETVGSQIGQELKSNTVIAVGFALLGIMIYIWLRFEWQFSMCAVLALLHDIAVTIGFFCIVQLDFNLSTMAAILTIAGYSINDTVVVFDRVRENLRLYQNQDFLAILNKSTNETLSRTILTSITTFLALLALYVFGGSLIKEFAVALMFGVIIGTYSSIFVAVGALSYFNIDFSFADDDDNTTEPAGGQHYMP